MSGIGAQRPQLESLSELDRKLLNLIQDGFPLAHSPYAELARDTGADEKQVFERVRELVRMGVIRRIGGVFDTRQLGFAGTLAALRAPRERIREIADIVTSYSGVSHCYERDDAWNLWFTLAAPSAADIESILEEIRARTGIADALNLPAVRVHKIGVRFGIGEPES